MDDERLKRIDAFLAPYGASVTTLPASRSKQLEKVDEAIQRRLAAIKEAHGVLQKNSINVSTISVDTGISRKTFYNNEILRLYVEYYAEKVCTDDQASKTVEIESLKQKNEDLSQQVRKFVMRDIDTENLRQENFSLTLEVERLNRRIKSLESQYEQAQIELAEARMKTRIDLNRVIPFSK